MRMNNTLKVHFILNNNGKIDETFPINRRVCRKHPNVPNAQVDRLAIARRLPE